MVNLLQKTHDKVVEDLLNKKLTKEEYFEIERLLEINRELYTVCKN